MLVVWVRHVFSQGCIPFNHVFILKLTHFPLCSELYCCRCRAKYRQLYEQWEHISAGITLQTGCGGGGGGFSLTDLSFQSHLFFGLSAPEHPVSRWNSESRIKPQPWVILNALSKGKSTVCERDGRWGWGGGWVAFPSADWCNPPRNTQSLRGRLCGLERVYAEVSGHHWLWDSVELI